MATERLVVDHDPPVSGQGREEPVEMSIEVPPQAHSTGWGDVAALLSR